MMRHLRSALVVVCTALGVSCTEPMPHGAMVGEWVEVTSPHRSLTLNPNGTYSFLFESGVEFTRTDGQYAVSGNQIDLQPVRLVWRSASGDVSTQQPYPYGKPFQDATYELNANVLTLHYTSFPADGPVPTTMQLLRRTR